MMENNSLRITNLHIIDPSQHLDEDGEILILDGKIARIGEPGELPEGVPVMDGMGLCAAPGLVDIHVHLRDPGLTYKEDIFTGTKAAAAGGGTSVMCMPNTKPVIDSAETVAYILEKAKGASARVYPVAAITQGMTGQQLSDFAALRAAGAAAVSDDGRPVENAALMKKAMELCAGLGLPVASHCEDLHIIGKGIMNEGAVSRKLGVPGMDRSSEDSVTAREIALAAATGARVHICHVSTRGAVAFLRDAKARNIPVTAETAPHYFMLTEQLLKKRDANCRMNPPLREEADRLAILEAVRDGVIDVIATDHAPHSPEEKSGFETAPNGVVGLETSFAACVTGLVEPGMLTLYELIERMSTKPAELMKLPGGTLKLGAAADLFLFAPDERWVVEPEKFFSKGKNTPFAGMTLTGRVKYTFLGGKLVYQDK